MGRASAQSRSACAVQSRCRHGSAATAYALPSYASHTTLCGFLARASIVESQPLEGEDVRELNSSTLKEFRLVGLSGLKADRVKGL